MSNQKSSSVRLQPKFIPVHYEMMEP